MSNHWFWWIITMACLIWYSTIAIYVAIKGIADIKNMLSRLSAKQEDYEKNENNETNEKA